jgi:hypothetical protein
MRSLIRIAHLISIAMVAWLSLGALGAVAPARASAADAHVQTKGARRAGSVAWPGRPFARNSVWNRPLSRTAPLAAQSRSYVDEVVRQVDDYGPWLNTWAYSTPVYLVPAGQRTTRVTLDTWGPDLQASWDAVPMPANAVPSKGTDAQLTLWQPSRNRLWEFWKLHKVHGTWHARWGGAMKNVSRNRGFFDHSATTNDWGATATGLPLLGGLITTADLQRGYINHALAIALVETAPRYYTWPAQRTDGNVFTPGVAEIPEGTRFRLNPRLNIASLHLPPFVRMIATAAQHYGLIVRDKGGAVAFYGQDPAAGQRDLWGAALQGQYPNNLLRLFPWQQLQVVASAVSCCWGPHA